MPTANARSGAPDWSKFSNLSLYDRFLSLRHKMLKMVEVDDRLLGILLYSTYPLPINESNPLFDDIKMNMPLETIDVGFMCAVKSAMSSDEEPVYTAEHVLYRISDQKEIHSETVELNPDGTPKKEIDWEEVFETYGYGDAYCLLVQSITGSEELYGSLSSITEKLLQRKDVTLDEARAVIDKCSSLATDSKNNLFEVISTAASPSISQLGWASVVGKIFSENKKEVEETESLTPRDGNPYVFQEIIETVINVISVILQTLLLALSRILGTFLFAIGFLFSSILPMLWSATDQNVVLNSGAANLYVYGTPATVSVPCGPNFRPKYSLPARLITSAVANDTGVNDFRKAVGTNGKALKSGYYAMDMYEWYDDVKTSMNITTALKASVDPIRFIKKIALCLCDSLAETATPPGVGQLISKVQFTKNNYQPRYNSDPALYPLFASGMPIMPNWATYPAFDVDTILLKPDEVVRASVDPGYAACSLFCSLLADSFESFYQSWRYNTSREDGPKYLYMHLNNRPAFNGQMGLWDLPFIWMCFVPGILRQYRQLTYSGTVGSDLDWLEDLDEWDDDALYQAIQRWCDISDVSMATETYRAFSTWIPWAAKLIAKRKAAAAATPTDPIPDNRAIFEMLTSPWLFSAVNIDTAEYNGDGANPIQSDDSVHVTHIEAQEDSRASTWLSWTSLIAPWAIPWMGSDIDFDASTDTLTGLTRNLSYAPRISLTYYDVGEVDMYNDPVLYAVDAIPTDWTYKPPYLSTEQVQSLTIGAAVVSGLIIATSMVLSRIMRNRKIRKSFRRQDKLRALAKRYDDHRTDENQQALLKATKKYNRLASFLNWPTYDPANNWFNEPSGMIALSAAAGNTDTLDRLVPVASAALSGSDVASENNNLLKILGAYNPTTGEPVNIETLTEGLSGDINDVNVSVTGLLQVLEYVQHLIKE